MKTKILAAIAVIAVIALLWFRFHKNQSVGYVATKVTRGSITSLVEASGTLNPVGNTTVDAASGTVTGGVTVGAQVTGRIMSVNVGFNSHVKKGDVLAEIDPTTYQADVDSASADLLNTKAALLKASSSVRSAEAVYQKDTANYINAKKIYERDQALVQKNYIAQSDLDAAQAAYQAAEAQREADRALIASAQDDVQAAGMMVQNKQASLTKAQTNLSYTRILSPVDGVVIASNAAIGQTVVASFQSPNLFVIAKSLKTMQIDTLVDEADVAKIKVGQTARFNVDTYPTETFKGRVDQIRNNPITQQNVVNYDVIVYVPNPDEKFLPGMTANVDFVVADVRDVLMIPNRALLFSPPETGKGKTGASPGPGMQRRAGAKREAAVPQVWVLVKNRPQVRKVSLGISDGSMTEVKSGLSEGDDVITGTTATKTKRNPFSTF